MQLSVLLVLLEDHLLSLQCNLTSALKEVATKIYCVAVFAVVLLLICCCHIIVPSFIISVIVDVIDVVISAAALVIDPLFYCLEIFPHQFPYPYSLRLVKVEEDIREGFVGTRRARITVEWDRPDGTKCFSVLT